MIAHELSLLRERAENNNIAEVNKYVYFFFKRSRMLNSTL